MVCIVAFLFEELRESVNSVPGPRVQSKYKPVRFTCKQRGAVLTSLYQAIAAARGSPVARKLLRADAVVDAFKLDKRGAWRAVQLRITAVAVERVDIATGAAPPRPARRAPVRWHIRLMGAGFGITRPRETDINLMEAWLTGSESCKSRLWKKGP